MGVCVLCENIRARCVPGPVRVWVSVTHSGMPSPFYFWWPPSVYVHCACILYIVFVHVVIVVLDDGAAAFRISRNVSAGL